VIPTAKILRAEVFVDSFDAVTNGVAQDEQGDYTLLFSRMEDGNHPVRVFRPRSRRKYEVLKPTGAEFYTSTRDFLAGERGTKAHWTHDRYFKLGRWNTDPGPTPDQLTVLDLFAPQAQDTSVTFVRSLLQASVTFTTDEAITTTEVPQPPCKNPLLAVSSTACGIDLENRSGEVAKLFFKAYGSWVRKARFEDDDVLQEIFKGVLVRNGGKCPWDPAKSTFGNYVTMVARGIVFNYHRRESRRRRRETVGYLHLKDGEFVDCDVAELRSLTATDTLWASASDESTGPERPIDRLVLYLKAHARWRDRSKLTRMATLLNEGETRKEITSKLRITSGEYTALQDKLRTLTSAWALSDCV
jgi:DNA-directed RNA polymerase specialized sigma24 family protein